VGRWRLFCPIAWAGGILFMMTYPRLRLFASALSLAFLAANCTVESGDDDDDDETNCTPGETRECTCDDGAKGSQTCTPAGTRFNTCVCQGGTAGTGGTAGEGGGGTTSAGNGGTSSGGTSSGGTSSGGTSVTGGASGGGGEGGIEGGTAGSGGTTDTGAGGIAGEGGSGGAGGENACGTMADPDPCLECVRTQCCAEILACTGDCLAEFDDFTFCLDELRKDALATPEDAGLCAEEVAGRNPWPSQLTPEFVTLANCMAGNSNDSSWPSQSSWSASSCRDGCFAKTP
jgi:hypothetical protein